MISVRCRAGCRVKTMKLPGCSCGSKRRRRHWCWAHDISAPETLVQAILTLTLPGPSAGVSGSLDSSCSLKPVCSSMGEVVPARTSPTLLPPSPRTVLSLSCFKVSQCINCPRHSVRLTYRPSAALWLLGSLRISHNKFLWSSKWILLLIRITPHNVTKFQFQWYFCFTCCLLLWRSISGCAYSCHAVPLLYTSIRAS